MTRTGMAVSASISLGTMILLCMVLTWRLLALVKRKPEPPVPWWLYLLPLVSLLVKKTFVDGRIRIPTRVLVAHLFLLAAVCMFLLWLVWCNP